MCIYKDVLCTGIIAPLLPCDLAGTLSTTWAIPSTRRPPLRGYSYHQCSNTCHQVVPRSHIHPMPFIGRRIIVSPSPSPASWSPPATPSWLSLPINWQPHFCFSSPACRHASYPALGVLDWKGYCSTVPWQVQSSSQFGSGHRSNAGKSVDWHILQYVLETILLLCHTSWYI